MSFYDVGAGVDSAAQSARNFVSFLFWSAIAALALIVGVKVVKRVRAKQAQGTAITGAEGLGVGAPELGQRVRAYAAQKVM